MAPSWTRWLGARVAPTRRSRKHNKLPARRFAVGDVHGCPITLRTLLDTLIGVCAGDAVFLLGDTISKGPDSAGVLATVLDLRARGINTTLLRGNHEDELLSSAARSPRALERYLEKSNNRGLLAADPTGATRLDDRWHDLIVGSVHYVALDTALLVHGAFAFDAPDPFAARDAMLRSRAPSWSHEKSGGRPVIHGHVAQSISAIIDAVASGNPIIGLDNGIVRSEAARSSRLADYGNLCALDLDTWDLFIQPNLDGNSPGSPFGLTVKPYAGRRVVVSQRGSDVDRDG